MSDRQEKSVNTEPSWRAVRYGKYRSQGQNFRAYLFANRRGRRFLRDLWRTRS